MVIFGSFHPGHCMGRANAKQAVAFLKKIRQKTFITKA
jgi:hypothetical protein